jgi:polysaccharide deacetylase family protein (PEP-CTERM system associated)
MKAFFTVDVEEYYHASVVEKYLPRHTWSHQPKRMEYAMNWLMEALAENATKATLFCLWDAVKHKPDLLRYWHNQGHEIACHTNTHRNLYNLGESELYNEIVLPKQYIEQCIGSEVWGFRAPNFSINDRAIEVLHKAGYRYDSSYFPGRNNGALVSMPGSIIEGQAFEWNPGFWEFPLSRMPLGSIHIPWSGGAYFRHFPWWVFQMGVNRIQKKSPYNFYIHPWDWDKDHPSVAEMSLVDSFRHNRNRKFATQRMQSLLRAVEFEPIKNQLLTRK